MYVLAVDCGGTNTRISLILLPPSLLTTTTTTSTTSNPGETILATNYTNKIHSTFNSIVTAFLLTTRHLNLKDVISVIACAGPVKHNRVIFTSNSFVISGSDIERDFECISKCVVVNDFVACGYGLLTIDHDKETVCLNSPVDGDVTGGVVACVGAGTGLGECYLTSPTNSDVYTCHASEGSHADYAPSSAITSELHAHLCKKYGGTENNRISMERIVSGNGITDMYDFLSTHDDFKDKRDDLTFTQFNSNDSTIDLASLISKSASICYVCDATMRIFATAYGSECSNVALKFLPFSGLYLTGGIIGKNLDYFVSSKKGNEEFMTAFFNKGRVKKLLKDVPVWAVVVEDLGVRGAWVLGVNLWRERIRMRMGEGVVEVNVDGGGKVKEKDWRSLAVGVTIGVVVCGVFSGLFSGRKR